MVCPHCGGSTAKYGHSKTPHGERKQRYKCAECGKTFTGQKNMQLKGTRYPLQVIAVTIWAYEKGFKTAKKGMKHLHDYINNLIYFSNTDLKPVSRQTLYAWLKKYRDTILETVSYQDTMKFASSIFRTVGRKSDEELLKLAPPQLRVKVEPYYDRHENPLPHKAVLQRMIEMIGQDTLATTARDYPEAFDYLYQEVKQSFLDTKCYRVEHG